MEMLFNRPLEHHPLALFAIALIAQWLAAYLGHSYRRRREEAQGAERADLSAILHADLTLLALLIGFAFAMALGHYDERKNLEEAEATAIGTAYLRADLLPAGAAAQARELLRRYAEQRIRFYRERDPERLPQIRSETDRLEAGLWSLVTGQAAAGPTPIAALGVSGMNDVVNSEARTEAAWRRHVPVTVWWLIGLVALAGNLLLGVSEKRKSAAILAILPLVVAVPLFLIADLDTPRAGLIRVVPLELMTHAKALGA